LVPSPFSTAEEGWIGNEPATLLFALRTSVREGVGSDAAGNVT
jgi:hypothetical protein